MSSNKTSTQGRYSQYKSLASYLKHLEGEELTIELKNGRQFSGILINAEEPSMNLMLLLNNPNSSTDNNDGQRRSQIRGSAIRYIHFPEDYMETIRAAQDRERSAQQKYRRGLRK